MRADPVINQTKSHIVCGYIERNALIIYLKEAAMQMGMLQF